MARRSGVAGLALLAIALASPMTGASSGARPAEPERSELARQIVRGGVCPCGCGNHLPGSGRPPECFGCAVGKAEVTSILEGIAGGMDPAALMLRLGEPVLIDVFSDYTDPGLPKTWERARRIAAEFDQHRVVLRTPAASDAALSALRIAECAREQGAFTRTQPLLIRHAGPWGQEALLGLLAAAGIESERMRGCLERIDVAQQVAKDREHAAERGFERYPAVSVNRRPTADRDAALREAIGALLRERSL